MIFDPSTEKRLKEVFPDLAERWRSVAMGLWYQYKIKIKVTEGLRSTFRQSDLWAQGRARQADGKWTIVDKEKVITFAPAGSSFHEYGLALDTCFTGKDPYLENVPAHESSALWNEYGKLCKAYGLEWGGDWAGAKNDRTHCEKSYGMKLKTVQSICQSQGIRGVWQKCVQV